MICPSCHNDQVVTEHSYGALYTCQSCQAVYFIDFNGQPDFSEVEQLPEIDEPLDMGHLPPTNLPDAVSEAMDELTKTNVFVNDIGPLESPVQFTQNEFAAEPNPFENFAPIGQNFSDVAKDISDYGNSETQIAHLNYDLNISGIDSAEVMALLKEAIEDSRFGWDANELIRTIRSGEMTFEKLNPVKAYILSKRLQFIDVEKVWKQNAVG